jgi:hypothetical protein
MPGYVIHVPPLGEQIINFAKIGIINNLSNPALARSNRLRYVLLGPAKAA